MTNFGWTDELSVYDNELDEHHKVLLNYIQVLSDPGFRTVPSTQTSLGELIDGLLDYADFHFAAEERVMRDTGYPERDAHCGQHLDFTRQIGVLRTRFGQGESALQEELLRYLREWFVGHIKSSDQRLGDFLKARKVENGR